MDVLHPFLSSASFTYSFSKIEDMVLLDYNSKQFFHIHQEFLGNNVVLIHAFVTSQI